MIVTAAVSTSASAIEGAWCVSASLGFPWLPTDVPVKVHDGRCQLLFSFLLLDRRSCEDTLTDVATSCLVSLLL